MSNFSADLMIAPSGEKQFSRLPQFSLGARVSGGGRIFRYVKWYSGVAVPGQLVVAEPVDATVRWLPLVRDAKQGDIYLRVTLPAGLQWPWAENDYAGGQAVVNGPAAARGVRYLISGHPAGVANQTIDVRLDEPLVADIPKLGSSISYFYNPFKDVTHLDNPTLLPYLGVALSPIPNTYWGWIQTRGLAACLLNVGDTEFGMGTQLYPCTNPLNALTASVANRASPTPIAYALDHGYAGDPAYIGSVFLMCE